MSDSSGQSDAIHGAAQKVSETAQKVSDAASRMSDKVQGAVGQAGDMAQEFNEAVVEARRIIREQPVTMGLVLLGFGYVVGRIMTPRRR